MAAAFTPVAIGTPIPGCSESSDSLRVAYAAKPSNVECLREWIIRSLRTKRPPDNTVQKAITTMKKSKSRSNEEQAGDSASQQAEARIQEPNDWRGDMLARIRMLIKQADPEVVEEVKWRKPSNPAGVPVWSHAGMICTGETYKNVVKLTFAKGASLKDPQGLFNSSLEGNTRRAIDFHEDDQIDEKALMALIRAAVALNTSAGSGDPRRARAAATRPVRSQKRPKG